MPDSLPPEDEIARLRAEIEAIIRRVERGTLVSSTAAKMIAECTGEYAASIALRVGAQLGEHAVGGRITDAIRTSRTAGKIIPPTLHTHPNPKREER